MDGVVVVAPVESGVLELEGMITGALVVVAVVVDGVVIGGVGVIGGGVGAGTQLKMHSPSKGGVAVGAVGGGVAMKETEACHKK